MQLATQDIRLKMSKETRVDVERFAGALRRIRGKRSQTAIAKGAYIEQPYYSEIERGVKVPSPGVIIDLAHSLGIDSGSLFRYLDPEMDKFGVVTEYLKLPKGLAEEDAAHIRWLVNRLAGIEEEEEHDPAREAIEREWEEEERTLKREHEKENHTH